MKEDYIKHIANKLATYKRSLERYEKKLEQDPSKYNLIARDRALQNVTFYERKLNELTNKN